MQWDPCELQDTCTRPQLSPLHLASTAFAIHDLRPCLHCAASGFDMHRVLGAFDLVRGEKGFGVMRRV